MIICQKIRRAMFVLLSLLAPTLALGQQEAQRFKQLLEDSWEFDLTQSPVFATRLGDHRFDDRLSDESLDNQRARQEQRQRFYERWTAIDRRSLLRADQISYDIFGRLLNDKGLRELVEAGSILRQRGVAVTIRLVGAPDPSNPASIDAGTLAGWRRDGVVELHPWTDDVPGVWRDAHLAVLPSYREGFGMSLAEAAATGRALIASDVAGCRDVVRDGVTGLLVPPRDAIALAEAIERLARDTDTRRRFAGMARRDSEQRFALERITRTVLELYETALRAGCSP